MAETFDDFFTSLMYGNGSILGLILILAFFILLTLAWKYSPVLLIPASIIVGISYIQHDLIWNFVIMTCYTVFGVFHAAKEFK